MWKQIGIWLLRAVIEHVVAEMQRQKPPEP